MIGNFWLYGKYSAFAHLPAALIKPLLSMKGDNLINFEFFRFKSFTEFSEKMPSLTI